MIVRVAVIIRSALLLCLAAAVPPRPAPDGPPWHSHMMICLTDSEQPRPWRTDARFLGFLENGYPDDALVGFGNPVPSQGARYEAIWMTIIAYDSATDLFLGIVSDRPLHQSAVQQWDNVVFQFVAGIHAPVAATTHGSYETTAWPPTAVPAFRSGMLAGIRAYRDGRDGHNIPGIERCIQLLTPLAGAISPKATADERFVTHYVLGRCLAEKYETERAAEQFRAAIRYDSMSLNAHMGLLAELSVMTHRKPGTLSPSEEARWDQAFVTELAIVRKRFWNDGAVRQLITAVFDPAQEAAVDSIWRPYIPRLKRVGFASFRWKRC